MTDEFEGYDEFDDDVGLGEEDTKYAKRGGRQEWFKGEKGKSYRVSLMFYHPIAILAMKAAKKADGDITKEQLEKVGRAALAKRAEELEKPVDQLLDHEKLDTDHAKFHKVTGHYKEGVGFVISRLGKDGAEADTTWKMMGDPKDYFTTTLLLYPCNSEGEVNKKLLKINEFEAKPWRISSKVYGQLHQVAAGLRSNELSIATQDLVLKCTNSDYQNFDVQPSGKSLWRRIKALENEALPKVVSLYDEMRKPFRDLSTADLALKLGVSSGGSSQGTDVDADDFDELLDQV